jgi:hypothetical protein
MGKNIFGRVPALSKLSGVPLRLCQEFERFFSDFFAIFSVLSFSSFCKK